MADFIGREYNIMNQQFYYGWVLLLLVRAK